MFGNISQIYMWSVGQSCTFSYLLTIAKHSNMLAGLSSQSVINYTSALTLQQVLLRLQQIDRPMIACMLYLPAQYCFSITFLRSRTSSMLLRPSAPCYVACFTKCFSCYAQLVNCWFGSKSYCLSWYYDIGKTVYRSEFRLFCLFLMYTLYLQ